MTIPPSISGASRPPAESTDRTGTSGNDAGRRDAGSGDAQRFDDMMRGKDGNRGNQGEGERGGQQNGQGDGAPANPFDLFRSMAMPSAMTPADTSAATPRGADLNAIVATVAEQILVADNDGREEVRIQLKDSVLPGVEIRVRQDNGRTLIDFVCTNADSVRFLLGQQAGLASMLGGRLNSTVEVSVISSDGTTAHTADSDSGDGRSRNHYTAPEDMPDPDDDNNETPS